MGDEGGDQIQELKDLVAQQARDTANLIAEMARMRAAPVPAAAPVVHVPAAPNAAAVRGDKISKLGIALRKSYKVKEFRETHDFSVKEWMTRFDQEITALKKMNGIVGDLTRDEMIELFKDKLDYAVVKRLNTAFTAKDPV